MSQTGRRSVDPARRLSVRCPEVARELDEVRSGFGADQVSYGSKAEAWWRCPSGHSYSMSVNQRTNAAHPAGCPYCAGKRVAPERSLLHIAPDLAEEFVSGSNEIAPSAVSAQSNRRFWWQCPHGHRWQATPNNRVSHRSGCPFCSGARVSDRNRLSVLRPDLVDSWDRTRNQGLTPDQVSAGSGMKVWWSCPIDGHQPWRASIQHRAQGRGCPSCAGHIVTSSNRLSDHFPELAAQLDETRSGLRADELSVGSNRTVWWRCPVDPQHTWPAKVLNRTKGHTGEQGTACPFCKLPKSSRQELRLKAELSLLLPIEPDLRHVPTEHGRIDAVDILVPEKKIAVEFDGVYFHSDPSAAERDAAKSRRLRRAGWTVIRVREQGLDLLDPHFDVPVPVNANAFHVTLAVADKLLELGLLGHEDVNRYRAGEREQATPLADRWITEGHAPTVPKRTHDSAWNSMYTALEAFAAQHGHCEVPGGPLIEGRDLASWCAKQRTAYRKGTLTKDRERRLRAIPTWTFDTRADFQFREGLARFVAWAIGQTTQPADARAATVWTSSVRTRRQVLQKQGSDLPAWQIEALEQADFQWAPHDAQFAAKIALLRDYAFTTGQPVSQITQRLRWRGHPLGVWINSWQTRRDDLDEARQREIESLPGWTWAKRQDAWERNFADLVAFADQHGHVRPSLTAPDTHEQRLARWKRNNKHRLRDADTNQARRFWTLLSAHGEPHP